MKAVISHLTGNANVRAATYGLIEANLLAEFHVSIATFPGSLLDRLGGISIFSEIRRRRFEPVLQPYVKAWPWLELGRLLAPKIGFSKLTSPENSLFYIDAVCQNLDKRVASHLKIAASQGVSAIYGYEDTVAYSFQEAKNLGLKCFYDLPIGYWRAAHRLMATERERWPDWVPTMTGLKDSEAKLTRKDQELNLADRIFVASSFTANTLKDFPGTLAPIEVIPYGFPPVSKDARQYSNINRQRALKLLFVGGLSQRKGIADLFAVVEKLKHRVELTIVGRKKTDDCPVLDAALVKHRWISSLPHSEILQLMREHDVLIFPSLFEGFGLVITEAMSQGTPVITTERTAGPDLIEPNQNGWLVQAGSTQSLQEAIEELLYHPEKIAMAGREAMETARRRSWETYGRELAEAVSKFI